jgi:hypothetical protein
LVSGWLGASAAGRQSESDRDGCAQGCSDARDETQRQVSAAEGDCLARPAERVRVVVVAPCPGPRLVPCPEFRARVASRKSDRRRSGRYQAQAPWTTRRWPRPAPCVLPVAALCGQWPSLAAGATDATGRRQRLSAALVASNQEKRGPRPTHSHVVEVRPGARRTSQSSPARLQCAVPPAPRSSRRPRCPNTDRTAMASRPMAWRPPPRRGPAYREARPQPTKTLARLGPPQNPSNRPPCS